MASFSDLVPEYHVILSGIVFGWTAFKVLSPDYLIPSLNLPGNFYFLLSDSFISWIGIAQLFPLRDHAFLCQSEAGDKIEDLARVILRF